MQGAENEHQRDAPNIEFLNTLLGPELELSIA
jgi:hypothetical protein